jgi:serine/threonine-protein kinase
MGIVYLAAVQGPANFNKLLVVKELKPNLSVDESYVSMFLDEARLAARLAHPNIVQTIEVGSEAGRHYMVMEFLDGRSLHRIAFRHREKGFLPVGAQLRIIAEALHGLHYAHDLADFDGVPLGVVHRDVSPLNVFVTFDGQTKVLDFGIAKTSESSIETKAGILKGRVAYMAPEQAWGKADRRADVYSAGVMLWEAAAGRRLWQGMNDVEILSRLLHDRPPSLRSVQPNAPKELEAICARAMATKVQDRYESAAALLEDLEAHLGTRDDMMTMREIGALAARAFDNERRRMKASLEEMLSRMRRHPRSGVVPTFASGVLATPSGVAADEADVSSPCVVPGSLDAPSSTPRALAAPTARSGAPRATPARAGRALLRALGAGLAVAGLIAVVLVFHDRWQGSTGDRVRESAAATPRPPAAVSMPVDDPRLPPVFAQAVASGDPAPEPRPASKSWRSKAPPAAPRAPAPGEGTKPAAVSSVTATAPRVRPIPRDAEGVDLGY